MMIHYLPQARRHQCGGVIRDLLDAVIGNVHDRYIFLYRGFDVALADLGDAGEFLFLPVGRREIAVRDHHVEEPCVFYSLPLYQTGRGGTPASNSSFSR
jgi:hypothetical protein